jgi:hypothetical protein
MIALCHLQCNRIKDKYFMTYKNVESGICNRDKAIVNETYTLINLSDVYVTIGQGGEA